MRTESSETTVNWDLKSSPWSDKTVPVTDVYTSWTRQRDEPFSTPKINGKYVYPTNYLTLVKSRKHGMSASSKYGTRYCAPPSLSAIGHPNVSLIDTSNVVNAAIVNAGRSQASFGESLAEVRETAAMFSSGALRAISAVNLIRRKDFKGAAHQLGLTLSKDQVKKKSKDRSLGKLPRETASEAASRHLLIQFGIMPVVDDIFTAIDLFENGLQRTPGKENVVFGFATNNREVSLDEVGYYSPHAGRYSSKTTCSIRQTCKLRYVCKNRSLLYAANQLGLANPVKTAYDILPLSFVVDWFWPIGNYLETMSSTFGLRFTDGYVSTVVETKFAVGEQISKGIGGGSLVSRPSFHAYSFQRNKEDAYARPPQPQFPVNFGIGKAMTSLSLLAQRLG
jgi:hypothetical protein